MPYEMVAAGRNLDKFTLLFEIHHNLQESLLNIRKTHLTLENRFLILDNRYLLILRPAYLIYVTLFPATTHTHT